jgi:hypothetical protein
MSLGDVLLGLLPLIVLIAAVLLLLPVMMRRLTGPGSATAQHLALVERQTQALERIAVALEKRSA